MSAADLSTIALLISAANLALTLWALHSAERAKFDAACLWQEIDSLREFTHKKLGTDAEVKDDR